MKFSARVLGFIFAFIFLFFISKSVFAQTNSQSLSNNSSNPNLGPYAQNVLIQVMGAVGCQLAGVNPASPKQPCIGIDHNNGKFGVIQNDRGLLGFMSGMIISLYNPPVHTSDYINYLAGNFGISKSAYAQGVGFTTISPIAGLWIAFRNVVYLFFVIIFVLIGLGIMLRVKIDPRTVMTIQNQIPRIVIGIILVTLSFPIAGFLIDLMWIVIFILINMFLSPLIPGMTSTAAGVVLPNQANFTTPFGLLNIVPATNSGMGGMFSIMSNVAGFIGSSIANAGLDGKSINSLVPLSAPQPCDIFCLLGGIIGTVIGAILGAFIGFAVGLVAFFVVAIALIYSLFKLWFELLKAYISILIGIIFAPFWIAAGLIPGGGDKIGFSAWIREMLGNLMAFPTAILMFFLAAVFTAQFNNNYTTFFLPPLISSQSNGLGAIIAFGIMMMTPNVVKMTKAAFKSSAGFGIGGGVGVGAAVIGAPLGKLRSGLFGEDKYGQQRVGSAYIGRKFGSVARGFSGGSFSRSKVDIKEGISRFRVPGGGAISSVGRRVASVGSRIVKRGGSAPSAPTVTPSSQQKASASQPSAPIFNPEKTHRETGSITPNETTDRIQKLKDKQSS